MVPNADCLWDERLSGYSIFERLIQFANCPLKSVSFGLAHWLLVRRGTFWPPFILVYRWTKGRDGWNSLCPCTVASRHYPIEDGSCSFFSGLIGLHEKRASTLPYPQLLPNLILFTYFGTCPPLQSTTLIWHSLAPECPLSLWCLHPTGILYMDIPPLSSLILVHLIQCFLLW